MLSRLRLINTCMRLISMESAAELGRHSVACGRKFSECLQCVAACAHVFWMSAARGCTGLKGWWGEWAIRTSRIPHTAGPAHSPRRVWAVGQGRAKRHCGLWLKVGVVGAAGVA